MTAPRLSVVIPVRNGERTLPTQLRALGAQVDAPPFEVIVADNGSTDRTAQVALAFADQLDLRVVDASARRGPSFARNVGAAAARTARLAFCDADDRVSSTWVGALGVALETSKVATGPVLYVASGADERPDRLPAPPGAPRRYFDQVPFAPSNNLGMDASLFAALGGFDEALRCGEDADLTIRAQFTCGAALGWSDEAVVLNVRRRSLRAAALQFFRYGFYDASLYRKLLGAGLQRRTLWPMVRPYLVLAATVHRLARPERRWSWVVNAAQRAGRLVGSVRFRVLCL